MDLYLKNIYPTLGNMTTGETTQPEASDQMALVDDQKIQQTAGAEGAKKFNIFMAVGVLVVLSVVMGVFK